MSFSDDIAPTLPLICGDWETIHLGHLYDVYRVHDAVLNFKMSVQDAIQALSDLSERRFPHQNAFTVLTYATTCTCIAPLLFGAGFIDLPAVFCLGFFLGAMRTYLSLQSTHRDVLEILIVAITCFLARLLGTVSNNQICFSALAQTPLVLVIPGYTLGMFVMRPSRSVD